MSPVHDSWMMQIREVLLAVESHPTLQSLSVSKDYHGSVHPHSLIDLCVWLNDLEFHCDFSKEVTISVGIELALLTETDPNKKKDYMITLQL